MDCHQLIIPRLLFISLFLHVTVLSTICVGELEQRQGFSNDFTDELLLQDNLPQSGNDDHDDHDEGMFNNSNSNSLPSSYSPPPRQFFNPSIIDGPKCIRKSVRYVANLTQLSRFKRHEFKGCILKLGEQTSIENNMDTPINIGCMRPKPPKELELEQQQFQSKDKDQQQQEQKQKQGDNEAIQEKVDPWPIDIWLRDLVHEAAVRENRSETTNPNRTNTETISVSHMKQSSVLVINAYVDPEDDYNRDPPKWMCVIDRVNRQEYGKNDRIYLDVFSDYTKKETFSYVVNTVGVFETNPRIVKGWTQGTSLGKRDASSAGTENKTNISYLFPRSPGADFL